MPIYKRFKNRYRLIDKSVDMMNIYVGDNIEVNGQMIFKSLDVNVYIKDNTILNDLYLYKKEDECYIKIGSNVRIGRYFVMEIYSVIKNNCKIGNNCSIGEYCLIESNAVIGNGVAIDNNSIIESHVSIDSNAYIPEKSRVRSHQRVINNKNTTLFYCAERRSLILSTRYEFKSITKAKARQSYKALFSLWRKYNGANILQQKTNKKRTKNTRK